MVGVLIHAFVYNEVRGSSSVVKSQHAGSTNPVLENTV